MIYSGNVSFAVSLPGIKVLFVVATSRLILGTAIGSDCWIGASLAFCGIVLLQIKRENSGGRICSTQLCSFMDAFLMAVADCLVWLGISRGNVVFMKRPWFRYGREDWLRFREGMMLLVSQAFGMVNDIGIIGDADLLNILYITREL